MSFFDNTPPNKHSSIRGKTLNWHGSDTYKNFRKNQPNPYNEYSITYKFNNYGFRSDDFVPADYRLVFLGCSGTEGIGLPLEETFSYIIHSEIQKKIGKKFPYWNLGLSGCGLDSITRCYYNFYELLKPQVVISFFPSYRLEVFNEGWYTALTNYDPKNIFSKNPYLLEKNVIQYNTEKNLVMLDLMFEENKTLHIWDRWDIDLFKDIDLSRLDNFKNYSSAWDEVLFKKNDARDSIHPGKRTNEEFANIILEKYSNMICERLIKNY